MGILPWDLDGGLSLFRIIGDRRKIRPTPCQGSTLDDENPAPLVPEESDPDPTGIERIRAKVPGSFDGKSDDEIIAGLHLSTQPLGSRVHTTSGGFLSRAVPSS